MTEGRNPGDATPECLPGPQIVKLHQLESILRGMGSVLVAFSGGTDSSLLSAVAHRELGKGAHAVTVWSSLCPSADLEFAKLTAREIGIDHQVISLDVLSVPEVRQNAVDRCYVCKRLILSRLVDLACLRGIREVVEGSNTDDARDFRPGAVAVSELGIRSPLREAEMSKADVRAVSRALGLSVWSRPSSACLASRFPYGSRLEEEWLRAVDEGEELLRELGFRQCRIRVHRSAARIEVSPEEMERVLLQKGRIIEGLRPLGFTHISLDLEGYRTGSMNREIGR